MKCSIDNWNDQFRIILNLKLKARNLEDGIYFIKVFFEYQVETKRFSVIR
ncbi:MAG: hypothetical protein HN352_16110 [Bacteroidetes bacterium]|nr:hypothetical protein [Bacteroidota bacterium]MBT3751287.1 hypothetical protein [Bacteroidota bacterium]MBT4400792.1 hypothetical protein [Bacteroidota bacterium]MBT4411000.1 hypothetical protein [Bacteroidota bacterium]MBT7093249.1 hypothetical protein [Bacteroidota bacterium]